MSELSGLSQREIDEKFLAIAIEEAKIGAYTTPPSTVFSC